MDKSLIYFSVFTNLGSLLGNLGHRFVYLKYCKLKQ